MPKIEVTRKGNKYMIIMNNKLIVHGHSLGQQIIKTEASFISFIEARFLEKRGWLFELKISATAFLDDFECLGSGEHCDFLEKKLPTRVPKLVFPYDLEHYQKPFAPRSLLGVIETLNYQFRMTKLHYVWVDEGNKALTMYHGCTTREVEVINRGSKDWKKDEIVFGGSGNAFGSILS